MQCISQVLKGVQGVRHAGQRTGGIASIRDDQPESWRFGFSTLLLWSDIVRVYNVGPVIPFKGWFISSQLGLTPSYRGYPTITARDTHCKYII